LFLTLSARSVGILTRILVRHDRADVVVTLAFTRRRVFVSFASGAGRDSHWLACAEEA
jgi:hypothetical protein